MKDRVSCVMRRAALAVGLVAFGFGSASADIPASAYVQNGIIMQFDGVENAGRRLAHDATAANWTDLTGNHTLTVEGTPAWEADCAVFDGKTLKAFTGSSSLAHAAFEQKNATVEMCLLPTANASSTGPFAFGSNQRYIMLWASNMKFAYWPYARGNYVAFADAPEGRQTATLRLCADAAYYWSDGAQVGRIPYGSNAGNDAFTIGRLASDNRTNYAKMKAYSFRVYDRALTETELAFNATVDKVRFDGVDPAAITWPVCGRWSSDRVEYCVRATADGNGGVSADGSAAASPAEAWRAAGSSTSVTLTAVPAAGCKFLYWGGDTYWMTDEERRSASITVSATGPINLVAKFADANQHTVADYVQNGLVAHFDGIFNAGIGLDHNPVTAVWKELTGLSTDGTINFKEGKWMDGAFLRTGPNSSGPGYGKTSYLEYSLPQSFVDNLNAGGGYTIEVLTHFIGNSAGPGSLFALGGKNISTNLHLKADGSVLTHRNVGISSFGTLSSAKTNTVATVFDGTKTFSQYRNAILVKSVDNATAGAATKQTTTQLVGTFSAGSDWGSSVDAYAIRIYERALTPREIAMNARTDDERYFGSNVTYVVDVKSAYANPTPGAGLNRLAPGTGFSIDSDSGSLGEGDRATLQGWTWRPDGGTAVSGTGKEADVSLNCDGEFEWIWQREFEIGATAGAGGTAEPAAAWYVQGSAVTLTATPDAGKKFLYWSTDAKLAPEQITNAVLELEAQMPFKATAVFADANQHTLADYVQDGLVAHFDGIYNVGYPLPHDPATNRWKELTGKSTDGTISFKDGKWLGGAFLRSGPNSSNPGYATTSYLSYTLPQSFVDNLNAGGGYTIEMLAHFVGNSNGPGALFALGGGNTSSYLHLGANADRLTHRGVTAGANANTFFGSLSAAKTNTVTAIYDGKVNFSQYRNASLVKTLVCNEAPLRTVQADSAVVGTFSGGASSWGSSVDAYAIRIYDRPLTEKEVVKNNRVDDERYFGSNVTWVVQVSGDYGNPTPAKGVSRVVPGSGFAVESATESVGAGARMALSGWTWTPDVGEPVSGTTAEPTVVATGDGDFAWRWKKQYEITASAGAGGAVSTAGGWTDEGASVTFTATPDAGKKFLGWSGETAGLAIDTASATITFAADRARALTANFTDAVHEPATVTFAKKGEAGDFSWNDPEIWGGTLPGEGDEVVIEGESGKEPVITIDGPLPTFKSVFIRYAKVNFKGWNNALRATGDVTLSSFGKLTHEKATADLAAEQSRVWVVCENFSIVNSGSGVSVNGKGWPAVMAGRGISPTMNERSYSGPCGGVYGGLAGVGYGGSCSAQPFGSIEHPRDLGTAGSTTSANTTPGCGGGAVLIQARGTVTVGSEGIQANAGGGSGAGYYGGGSGGSVEIECETIDGSGTIQACGGGGGNGWGASGSGGRIAINCNAAKQDALGYSKLTFLARPGAGWNGAYCFGGNQTVSEHGSLYLSAKSLLNTNVNVSARVYFPTPSLTVDELNVPNQRRVEFQQDGFQLKVAGNVTLNGASGLVLGGDICQYFTDSGDISPRGSRRIGGAVPVKAEIGGSLAMKGAQSEVVIYPTSSGAALDANGCPAGAVLDVGRKFTMMKGAYLYPVSSGTNGISCAIRARTLDIQSGAYVSAAKLGFFGGCADNYKRLPGQTVYGYTGASWFPVSCTAGASHGGLGGGVSDERAVYDDVEHPVLPGAGSNIPNGSGLNGTGGHGGGVIHFEVARRASIAGTLQATGSTATGNGHACAAAGGSIYLKTSHLFVGENALLKANGCNSAGSPNAGGGGRIAIWRIYDDSGTVDTDTLTNTVCNVAGGTGNAASANGQPGTVFLGQLPKPGLRILVK